MIFAVILIALVVMVFPLALRQLGGGFLDRLRGDREEAEKAQDAD